ncbi:uncharacterized protein LOC112158141 isoform X2 [Oryzias melastigma]|uniref:uncharacterized protein LOC112158141 isoform X2 n=1 Tax=Oryzias melastigma TaxID=30732 RepID=UPI00168D3B7D|nr:uncharacterized protein LOC112158141 isoform X2 [Oryzias melastigma]
MSKKTEPYDACAASVQTIGTKAEFQTDSLMQNLSRENLNELFPGSEHLKLRKTIYEILHNQKQTHEFLKNLEDFIQQDSLNDVAVTEYLHRINNIKDELDQMQTVLGAHVKMQEDIKKNQVSQRESDVQTDSEIQTPQEEPNELLAGQEDLNIQKPTSQLQEEHGEVTQQDSLRASSTEGETVLTLLQEIEKNNPKAASELNMLGIQTDSQIKSLTPEDLNELFPGLNNLKLRKSIFQIINKKKLTDQLLEKPDCVTQQQFLMDECLKRITYLKKQLDEALTEAQVNTTENFRKRLDFKKDPHFQTDLVIQTLTREGLQKLFPGRNNFNLRKTMFEILHNLHKPNDLLLGESGDVTQQDAAEADYSVRIKNMKDQLNRMSGVIEKGYSSNSSAPMTTTEKQKRKEKRSDSSGSQWSILSLSGSSQKPSVKYKMVVSGQTFGAHRQLLDQIQTSGLNLIEINDEESCIIIVFCPVVSRIGTDAEAAMKKVPGDDPVILVFMHYSREPKHVSSFKVLTSYSNVILEVNIFYHLIKNGLLVCEQNRNAVIELRKTLNNYRTQSPESNRKDKSNSCASS